MERQNSPLRCIAASRCSYNSRRNGAVMNPQQRLATLRVRICSAIAVLMLPLLAHATLVYAPVARVTRVMSFAQYGTGDVVFVTDSLPPTCQDGYWIRLSDVGGKAVHAQLLAAFHAQTPLIVYAYDDQIWSGSGGRFCLVHGLAGTP
jgi:hypothetical protein